MSETGKGSLSHSDGGGIEEGEVVSVGRCLAES